MKQNKKILLISVGGSPEQTIKSIEINKCEYVIFFCSKDTSLSVFELLKKLTTFEVKQFEKIVTENHEDLNKSFCVLNKELPIFIERWGMSFEDIVVDYTGGTKAMSSALTLATIEKCNNFCYIGGVDREKEGVGVVINGSERAMYHINPWDALAIGKVKIIDTLFEKARFSAAVETLDSIKLDLDSNLKEIYTAITKICNGYNLWDNFKQKDSKKPLREGISELKSRTSLLYDKNVTTLIEHLENNFKWVEKFNSFISGDQLKNDPEAHRMLIIEMISNAVRRADKENKYDDAVARLYSSIEKLAKFLLLGHGIDNSKTTKDQIPSNLEEDFRCHKYFNEKESTEYYKYGFYKTCMLLSAIDEHFNFKYLKKAMELKELMNIRNSSILGHGITPVSVNTYEKMLKITMDFAEVTNEDLIKFPNLNLSLWADKLAKL